MVSKLVNRVITKAQIDVAEDGDKGEASEPSSGSMDHLAAFTGNLDSDSTRVLVPVNLIPEESAMRVGPTTSYVIRRHTFPVESEADTTAGGHIHRNNADLELRHSSEIFANVDPVDDDEPRNTERNVPSSSTSPNENQICHSLIDEICKELAESSTIFDFDEYNFCKN